MSDAARVLDQGDRRYTYADYKAWELDEGERYELIDGRAYAMAAPTDAHQAISGEIFRQIANFLQGKPCKVRPAPYDVRLFYAEGNTDAEGDTESDAEGDDTVVQPDISVICDEKKRGPEGCRGAPDLVVEILSPSNTADEYIRKFSLYLRAGVREYWIVSPAFKIVLSFILQNGLYTGTVYGSGAALPSLVLPGLSISLDSVFAP